MKIFGFRFFAIISLGVVVASCAGSQTQKNSIRKVKCQEVIAEGNVENSSLYPGKVEAAREVNRAFRVAGVIESIEVREGDFVSEGEVIAKMDDRDYRLQLEATEAEYAAVKGEADRVVQLFETKSTTANNYDKAVNGLKQIEAKLESHRNALADTELKSPFSGYVQKIFFDRGATVSAGMPILSIVSSQAPEVVVNIPASEYLKRDRLISASAKSELYGDKVFALKRIGTTYKANLNQLYEARFQLLSHDLKGAPSPGMSLMVSLNYAGESTPLKLIPFAAVVERDGATNVWVVESGRVALRKVVVGEIRSDGQAVVTSGLSYGEVVVTAGVNSLKEGQEVVMLSKKSESNVGNIL